MRTTLAVAVTLALALVLSPSLGLEAGDRVPVLRRQLPPAPWTCAPPPASHSATLSLTWALTLGAGVPDTLHAAAAAVSDPLSPHYARYWTMEQIKGVVDTHDGAAAAAVAVFLADTAALSATVHADASALSVSGVTPNQARALFGDELTVVVCTHPGAPDTPVVATLGTATLPRSVARVTAFVSGLSLFPSTRTLARAAGLPHAAVARAADSSSAATPATSSGTPCNKDGIPTDNLVVPSVVAELVGLPSGTRAADPRATQASVEFGLVVPHETGQEGGGGGGFQFADLTLFAEAIGIEEPAAFNVSRIIGPFRQTNYTGNAESLLDVSTMLALAPGSPTTYATYLGWLLEFALDVQADEERALVHSLSYGDPEYLMCNETQNGEPFDVCTLLGVDAEGYVDRLEVEFAKLALLGVTMVSSAGDNGAPGETSQLCQNDLSLHPLHAVYPAASAYFVAVGGAVIVRDQDAGPVDSRTQPLLCSLPHPGLVPGPTGVACAAPPYSLTTSMCSNGGITGGGGFANYTRGHKYQAPFVEAYLASTPAPPPSVFNASNRAYPDVSVAATHTVIIMNGEAPVGSGTSASAPQFAALVTLLNGKRLASGLPPLGAVGPRLYTLPASAFRDVTSGNNACTELACCKYGYAAAEGWDPATGRGVPRYPHLLEHLGTDRAV